MSKKVDFKALAQEFIETLNNKFKENENELVLGIHVTTVGKVKTIRFYSVNAETSDRQILYTRDYEVNNSAQFLTQDIEYILYRELFYNAIGFFGINMDAYIKQEQTVAAVENINPAVKQDPVAKALADEA